ncbi:MAG: ABC transporter permease [Eubacteriales bacterium]|nr:ABC transporter permease [Eubacteriales bacterium]
MKKSSFRNNPALVGLLASFTAIFLGLVFGFFMLGIFNPSFAGAGIVKILTKGLSSKEKFAKVLYQAAPLMMTGLSVGFAMKTGLFNIGGSGQYLIGTFCALLFGVVLKLPWYVCLLAAMLGGAFWGIFPGLFKALFNVNEVITAIMFNWIGLFLVNLAFSNTPTVLANYYGASVADRTANIEAANPSAVIPKLGMDKLFNSSYMNISFFVAMLVAATIYIIIDKTVFGYELKACGFNQKASIYAGINAKRNVVISMMIAGALAGLGGGIYYLCGTAQYTIEKVLPAMGFNGIPVALLANSNPIGIIFSALFISYIQVGGEALQPEYAKEIVDIIIACIIYLSALSVLMKGLITGLLREKGGNQKEVIEEAPLEETK